jgi:SGNH hydrolase-like domain, acetyltransferase AlgX
MEHKIKDILLYLLLAVLILPLAEQKLHFIKSIELRGGFKMAENVLFSKQGWMEGSFQHQKEQYLNDQMGFRPDFVRLTNQIDFSLFAKCHAGWDIKGKDGYLFQYPYIDAYYGKDYVGETTIREKAIKLKAIQDTLSHLGKSLILTYLPSKASSYPEYFPDNRIEKKGTTNYDTYRRICDSLNINQIDMDAWFVSMKHTSKEPLFSKQGIHWTKYAAIWGGDSLTRYIEQLRHIQVQHPNWSELEHTDQLRDGDDDIAKELNLIFPFAKEIMAYPKIKDIPADSERKINAIYIGDSYAHKMIEFGIIYLMNAQCEFWSLNKGVHDINGHKYTEMKDYNPKAAIDKTDCVVLAYTLFNFKELGHGFIEQAYEWYYPKGKQQ